MTQPPGDAWKPPQGLPTASSPVDAWGRPLPEFDPETNRLALARVSARLNTGLSVLLLVFLLGGLVWALALFFGGQAGLRALTSLTALGTGGGTGMPTPAVIGWLLGLAALLVLVLTAIYLGVIYWARELLSRLARWALSAPQATPRMSAQDAARTEKLRRTLAGWLSFGQWGTVVGVVFSVALVPITLRLTQQLADRFDPGTGGSFSQLGPGFEAMQMLSSLVSALPGAVVTWLILGAVRRFMSLSVQRARGLATAPVTPAARTVGNWFLLCLILLGLQFLYLLLVGVGLGVAGAVVVNQLGSSGLGSAGLGSAGALPGLGSGFLAWGVPLLAGVLVYAALLLGLYFALLLWSRTYALALARELDLVAAPPAALQPTALPTGSAGENPNIYRGQL